MRKNPINRTVQARPKNKIAIVGESLFKNIVLLFFVVFLSGCDIPSYPKERLADDVRDLVFKEYGYKIKVSVVGKTLGLFFPETQIFDYDMSIEDSFTKKSQDLFLTATRVTLSTDADIDFFVTKYSDKLKGIEIIMQRSVQDTKRLLVGNISHNDYIERLVFKYKYDLESVAKKTVKKLFKNIPEQKSTATSFFLPGKSYRESFFFKYLMESELKTNIKYFIKNIKAKRISEDKVLVYVELKETYDPKAGYEKYNFSLPSAQIRKILFELTVINGIIPIITATSDYDHKENIPEVFSKHLDISSWDDYFYLKEVKTSDFIINQIASRINRKISESENPNAQRLEKSYKLLDKPIGVKSTDGKFIVGEGGKGNTFRLILKFKEGISTKVVPGQIKDLSLLFFKRTLRKYDFSDYVRFEFTDPKGTVIEGWDKEAIDSMELDKFSWKSFIKMGPTQSY